MRVRRLPVIDEYLEDGEAAVFVDGKVVVLSELATTALALIGDDWSRLDVIADGLVRRYGPAPDDPSGRQSTEDALRALADVKIVELSSPSD